MTTKKLLWILKDVKPHFQYHLASAQDGIFYWFAKYPKIWTSNGIMCNRDGWGTWNPYELNFMFRNFYFSITFGDYRFLDIKEWKKL